MKLGIDFGTTTSLAATVAPGSREPVNLTYSDMGRQGVPSLVYINSRVSSKAIVGDSAAMLNRQYKGAYGDCLVRRAKMRMLQEPVGTVALLGNGEKASLPGGEPLTYERIAAVIIDEVEHMAVTNAKRSGIPSHVEAVTITLPSKTDSRRREMLRDAVAARIGLRGGDSGNVSVCEEPVAAAVYMFESGQAKGNSILVYDMGGGTCDVAIVERTSESSVPYSEVCSNTLAKAGDDFDRVLADVAIRKSRGPVTVEPEMARSSKEMLSARDSVPVVTSDGVVQVTRGEFEEAARPLMEETMAMTDDLINQYGKQVDCIICVGGSSCMPMVPSTLRKRYPHIPVSVHNPTSAISFGAAILAQKGIRVSTRANLAYGFGTMLDGKRDVIENLILPGAVLPATGQTGQFTVSQHKDNQPEIDFLVYKSDTQDKYVDRDGTEKTRCGAELIYDKARIPLGGRFAKGEIKFTVGMTLDESGILHLTVRSNRGPEFDAAHNIHIDKV